MGKQEALAAIDRKSEELILVSDRIWDHPELKFREQASAEILCGALKDNGFEVETGLAGIPTAFLGKFGEGKPCIGILGEFDALSGMSQKAGADTCAALEPGAAGHGCGHNLLGAGSLAAALAVKQYLEENRCQGTVIYFGCPGEEGGSGKAFMAREGVFDQVDAALSWHPNMLNSVWSFSTLANVQVRYRFKGKSAHAAASPHLGRSALDAMELMNVGIQFLREHIIPEARIHYAIINGGGLSPNVVQAEAEVLYLIRAPKNNEVLEIYERVNEIARGAAMMSGVGVEIQMDKGCSNIVVNRVLEQLLYENMKEVPLPEYTGEEKDYAARIQETMPERQKLADRFEKMMGAKGRAFGAQYDKESLYRFVMPYQPSEKAISGSSDVGDVSWVCPTSQIVAVTCAGGTPEHTWQMVAQGKSGAAHKGMLYAGKVLAGAAIDLLEKPELIEEAKKEHAMRVGPGGYEPLMAADVKPNMD